MLGRATAVAVLLVSITVLSGCISNGKKDDEKIQATNTTGLSSNQTIAPDGRGTISAFNETNKTETTGIGSMVHQHDYWHGKERLDNVAWINAGLIPFPLAPCKRPDGACTTGTTSPGGSDTYPPGTAIADFALAAPPVMGLIYEGTKVVEVKLAEVDTGGGPVNPLGHVYFDYLAANDEPGKFHTGGELQLNKPVSVEIKPTDADMPHQTKSLWVFRIYSDSQMVSFDFNITISLVKGYDVVNWPPHPNLYGDKPSRTVFDGPVKLASKGTIDANIWGADAGWVHPEKVISWGTDRVEIEVKDVKYSSQADQVQPSGWVFEYNNASKPPLLGNGAQYSARLKDAASDGKTFHFVIDLTGDRGDAMDTPYAQYSRWGFRLVPQFDNGGAACVDDAFLQQILVGCQFVPWEATYTMKIVAFGHSTAEGVPASAQ